MIVKLPSKIVFCKDCGRTGILDIQKVMGGELILVCGCITKSGKCEVIPYKKFKKRLRKLRRQQHDNMRLLQHKVPAR